MIPSRRGSGRGGRGRRQRGWMAPPANRPMRGLGTTENRFRMLPSDNREDEPTLVRTGATRSTETARGSDGDVEDVARALAEVRIGDDHLPNPRKKRDLRRRSQRGGKNNQSQAPTASPAIVASQASILTQTTPRPSAPVGPGLTRRYSTVYGKRILREEEWTVDGVIHRPASHGPAYRLFNNNGAVVCESYFTNGRFNNDCGGPSIIEYVEGIGAVDLGFYNHGSLVGSIKFDAHGGSSWFVQTFEDDDESLTEVDEIEFLTRWAQRTRERYTGGDPAWVC